ncbi:MAG: 1-acyl-sn-glycerol-3-phosphate acyltransferase [Akkermansia sp.]|nr:1-acyl-sn-glycerol-3-phosphate acyltransferase [Akkermansia sp.]
MNPLYFIILRLTQGVAQAFFKLKVINREKLIEDGACIYVMNHQSFLDPPMIGQLFTSTGIHFLARKTLFDNPFLGAILPYCNVIPIDQEQPDPGSILKVLRLVKNGGRIIIFPEGSRCEDNQIHDAMPGIGLILGRLQGVPIQPLRIDGAYDCLPIHSSKLRFKPITITIGDPIEFTKEELSARGRAGQLAIGKKVMDAIRALPTTC